MPINSFLYPAKNVPVAYEVANSLRFDDASSQYLNESQASGNRRTFTWSCWYKRGVLGNFGAIWHCNNAGHYSYFAVGDDDDIQYYDIDGASQTVNYKTNRVLRDPSAWTHLVLRVDTTQATEADRIRIYVNGTQETSFSASQTPSQNTDLEMNVSGHTFRIGTYNNSSSWLDGYLAECVFCDGQSLDPTSFGEFDSDSPNIWKPIDVTGLTFGTNGFYLDFEDGSSVGKDVSGQGNNFTANNLAATDQSTDTCTNNFATLNPLVKGNASITLSEGNLKGVFPGSWTAIPATFGLTKGKWYFEAKNETSGQNAFIGVVTENQDWDDSTPYNETTGVVLYGPGGRKTVDGTDTDGFFATLSSGQIVGVALDLDSSTKTIQFSVNGTDTPNSTPVDLPSTFDNVFIFPYFSGNSSSATSNWEINFGSPPYSISSGNSDGNGYGNFEYSVPSGFYSINSKNLAEFG